MELVSIVLLIYLIVKSMSDSGKKYKESQAVRKQVANEIIGWSKSYDDPAKRRTAEEIAGLVQGDTVPPFRTEAVTYAAAIGAEAKKPKPTREVNVDNATLLLYFGAFLFVAAAGLFIGLGGLGGGVKTFTVALVTATFYFLGLWLYSRSSALKPAGLAFVAIGMVLIPLCGVAAYQYLYVPRDLSAAPVWLFTSIIGMAAYAYAFIRTRQPLVSYAVVLAGLSLVESGVSVVSLPVYYYALAMALTGLAMYVIGRMRGMAQDMAEPLAVSAQLFVPSALVISLFMVNLGLVQLIASIVVGALFYAVATAYEPGDEMKVLYYYLAHGLAVLAIALGSYEIGQTPASVTFGLVFASVASLLLVAITKRAYGANKRWEAAVYVTAAIPAAVLVTATGSAPRASWALGLITAVSAALYSLKRSEAFIWLGGAAALILPSVLLFGVVKGDDLGLKAAFSYLILGFVLLATRIVFPPKTTKGELTAARSLYAIAFAAAWSAVFFNPGLISLFILAVLAVAFTFVSQYEKEAAVYGVLPVLMMHAVALVIRETAGRLGYVELPSAILIGSLAGYAAGLLLPDAARAKALRYASVGGAALAAILVVAYSETSLAMIMAVLAAGSMVMYEGLRDKSLQVQELGSGIIVGGLEWLMYYAGIREVLVYTHIWGAFFAFLAYGRYMNKSKDTEQAYTVFALTSLTLPLVFLSLGNPGERYGWMLIGEMIAVVFAGVAIKNYLVRNWGLVVAVAAVLYQLRELKFVVLGILALIILGIALYMLAKYNDPEKPAN